MKKHTAPDPQDEDVHHSPSTLRIGIPAWSEMALVKVTGVNGPANVKVGIQTVHLSLTCSDNTQNIRSSLSQCTISKYSQSVV